jgi:hypothetical protein
MTSGAPYELTAPTLFLADHAAVENGKLYVNGGYWNRLNFPSFPASINFSVGAVISVPWNDHREHAFAIFFETADGERIGGEVTGTFTAGAVPGAKDGDEVLLPVAATIGAFPFERPGDYTVVLHVDESPLNRWAFRAALAGAPAGGAGGGSSDPSNIPRF